MKTYITETTKNDGFKYAGAQINARNFEEAEAKAKEQGVTLVGELGSWGA